MRARVIALGRQSAGDDGVGPLVLGALRRRELAAEIELRHAADPTDLLALLETPLPVILIDAAVGLAAGQVKVLTPDDLASGGVQPVSSHGLGVGDVVQLSRRLSPGRVTPTLAIVAIGIAQPTRADLSVSPAVAAAVDQAADAVLDCLQAPPAPPAPPEPTGSPPKHERWNRR